MLLCSQRTGTWRSCCSALGGVTLGVVLSVFITLAVADQHPRDLRCHVRHMLTHRHSWSQRQVGREHGRKPQRPAISRVLGNDVVLHSKFECSRRHTHHRRWRAPRPCCIEQHRSGTPSEGGGSDHWLETDWCGGHSCSGQEGPCARTPLSPDACGPLRRPSGLRVPCQEELFSKYDWRAGAWHKDARVCGAWCIEEPDTVFVEASDEDGGSVCGGGRWGRRCGTSCGWGKGSG